ncbi:hypothetical protein [Nocardioides sp.]|uniref:hypothetical protein n=1 Tax=Nocardioides sp. TaxID=35761 RepID=UPI003512FEF3
MDIGVGIGLGLAATWLLAAGTLTVALARTAAKQQPFRIENRPGAAPGGALAVTR